MVNHCIENLLQIRNLVERISDEDLQKKTSSLFNSSIGEHVRHIIEFYACLIDGIESGSINYDNRKRQKAIEQNSRLCLEKINEIIDGLNSIPHHKALKVEANFSEIDSGTNIVMDSSLQRELGYCLEHSVHHQALIKTALKEHGCLGLIEENFGIAASTLRNRNLCVQ
jgi:uncharacterized damage-inducible protein DinB